VWLCFPNSSRRKKKFIMNRYFAFPPSCLVLSLLALIILAGKGGAQAQESARIGVIQYSANEVGLAIDPVIHQRLGVSYPLTFRFSFPGGAGLTVEWKHDRLADWTRLTEKSWGVLYNAVEAVRIDSAASVAYVSVAFAPSSDSVFLKFTSGSGASLGVHYLGMPKYYDGRRAAVTVTADDWADWFADMYPPLLSLFRSYGLCVTAGAITAGVGPNTWLTMQKELDSGFVEVSAHSRTHPSMPYQDYPGEVVGCIDDILSHLGMPPLFSKGAQGYVYVWIAPNGRSNATVDSLLTVRNILVNRLYGTGDTAFSAWSPSSQHFLPINPTLEIGNPSWGGGETRIDVLNATFDSVTARGGIYHFMWHPQTLYPDIGKAYLSNHLKHVSRRNDLWYVNLGHLYLYHYFQMANGTEVTSAPLASTVPGTVELMQNYPNPFNPKTGVRFQVSGVSDVTLVVYDLLGRVVGVLVNERKAPGTYEVAFDGNGLASGVYIYRLRAGSFVQTRKMILMK
jgi:hypothetical protein